MYDWLQATGLREGTLIGGSIGALVSLKFAPGTTWWQRLVSVLGGAATSAFVAPLIVQYFSLSDKLESGFAFLVGMFGMTIASAVMESIPPAIAALRAKWIG